LIAGMNLSFQGLRNTKDAVLVEAALRCAAPLVQSKPDDIQDACILSEKSLNLAALR
jgi:hypothetical protein